MRCQIVVEGSKDRELLKWLLAPVIPKGVAVAFVEASGKNMALALAQSVQAHYGEPVCLAMDADTYNDESIAELRRDYEFFIGKAAGSIRPKVCFFIPEIEAVLFEDSQGLEDEFGARFNAERKLRGKFEPKKVLCELLKEAEPQALEKRVIKLAKSLDPKRLVRNGAVKEVLQYLQSLSKLSARRVESGWREVG